MLKNKYRVWDKDSKIMIYSDFRNKREYFCEYRFEESQNDVTCFWSQEIEDSCGNPVCSSGKLDKVEKYTGYKDKNGMEIYEGDIIICGNDRICVNFDNKYSDSKLDMLIEQNKDIEVIGNIYLEQLR